MFVMFVRIISSFLLEGLGTGGRFLTAFSLFFTFLSCGLNPDSQYTNKLIANPFVSNLYGQTTKTIALSVDPGSHIAWMGLDQSANYKFFKIEKISVDGTEKKPDSNTPVGVVTDITVDPAQSAPSGEDPTGGMLLVTLTYTPLQAIQAETNPHRAYLLILFDKPDLGTVRVELDGYTRGISDNKCIGATQLDKKQIYGVKGKKITLYLCDQQAVVGKGTDGSELNNDTRPFTNVKEIPIEKDFTFYQADEETVCINNNGDNDPELPPTIPDFTLPVPPVPKLPPALKGLGVEMASGVFIECKIDGTDFLCDQNVQLEVLGGKIPVSPLTFTNGPIVPTSRDCAEFPEPPSGSGEFGANNMTLVAWGNVESSNLITEYKVDGALIVAVLELIKKED